MRLFTRTYLQGMHDGLVDSGVMRPLPNDDIAIGVFDKIAQEAGLPPVLEAQLAKEAALPLAQRMKAVSDKLASEGVGPSATRIARAKQAGLYDLQGRAAVAATFYMEKAAADGSLTDNNENTLANAAPSDQLAAVDNANRSEGTYRTPRGETDLPAPGVIGREVPAPHAPTTGTTVKAAGRFDALLQALKTRGAAAGTAINDVAEQIPGVSRMRQFAGDVLSNPVQNFRDMRHGAAAMTDHASNPLGRDLARQEYTGAVQALKNQGLALGGAGALAGLGAGAHHLLNRGNPGPEDMQGMEVQASEANPLHRTLTFLVGLHRKTGGWIPSEEAKVAAAGLGAAGAAGLEAMSLILGRAKTAEDAEGELAEVLHVLDQQGIPPDPELVHALAQALGEGGGPEAGGMGGPPPEATGAPPAGPPEAKEGALSDIGSAAKLLSRKGQAFRDAVDTVGHGMAERTRSGHIRDAASTLGKGVAGVGAAAGVAALAMGAKNIHKRLKGMDDNAEKSAEDAFWADILKAAGEGSLTETDANTLANAKKDDQLAEVDQKNRPEGKYKTPPGKTELSTEPGEVGAEKKVAEDAYHANLKQAAATWGSQLPAAMPIERKREEIQKIASLAPSQRAAYVQSLRG
jgi:hypothetical protein